MASMNRVIIMGNLGQDPELRYTQSQTPVCTLNVATTDYRTGADGQRIEQTEWHRVVVWSKQAENCAKYLAKGRSVMVEGRLSTRSWEDKQGQKRYVTEIVAQNVQFIGSGATAGQPRAERPQQASQQGGGYNNNRGQSHQGEGQGAGHGGNGGGYDAELPDSSSFGGPETPALDDIPF